MESHSNQSNYAFVFAAAIVLSIGFVNSIYAQPANNSQEIFMAVDSDREYVVSLLREIIYDNVKFDTEWETRSYSDYASREIVMNKAPLEDSLRVKLNLKLLEDVDFYQRLQLYSKELISSNLHVEDAKNAPTYFYKMPYWERVNFVKKVFIDSYKLHLDIDFDSGIIRELKSQNMVMQKIEVLEDYAKILLNR